VIIRVEAAAAGRTIQGIGEAAPRSRTTGDTRVGSWRFLEAALGVLERTQLRRRPADALADVAATMDQLRDLAAEISTKKANPKPYRGMLAGLESALLDLAAKAAGVGVPELLAAGMPPALSAPGTSSPPAAGDLPPVVMAGGGPGEEARSLAVAGAGAIGLSPQRLGGPLAVVTAVGELRRDFPDLPLVLCDVPHLSDVGVRILSELSASIPGLSHVVIPQTAANGVRLGEDGSLILTSAVSFLTRYADGPSTPRRPMRYADRPANIFDVEPLLPFATPKGEIRFASPLIERAALTRGLNTVRMTSRELVVDHAELPTPLCFTPSKSAWTGRPAHRATVDKELTRALLHGAGVPVPEGAAFEADQVDDAVKYALSLDQPVVVKPRNGIHGTGVSTDLRTEAEIRAAIELLGSTAFRRQPFIVETFVPGDDYRLLVVGDQVVSVVLKRPASVVGDGRSSVVDLVLEKNRWRLENPHTRSCLLGFGDDAMSWLGRQGLAPDSVPENGRFVRLGSAGNIAAGGESIEVLDETHPSLLELAVRAVHAVPGLDHAGIDLMGDHVHGVDGHPAAIIEVNGNPATTFNHFPLSGTPRDVSSHLVLRGCELAGFDPGAPRAELSLRIEIDGRVQGIGYRKWFARLAEERGVAGTIRNLPSGGVEAYVTGSADDAWVLAAAAIHGPRRASVLQVRTTHVDGVQAADGFEVHE
jgi:D-alanine-D-alanine ligase-like ATP-grasp enzyme/acylphosphatase